MKRYKGILLFLICILTAISTQAQAQTESADKSKTDAPKIVVTKLDISDKQLKLNYEIRNDSDSDVWICDSISTYRNFELFMDDDGQTLILRKRLDVPCSIFWSVQPEGKYVRLRPGQKRVESLLLTVPINNIHYFYGTLKQLQRSDVNATRFSIEIGYYVGNLPKIYLDTLKPPEKNNLYKIHYSNILNEEVFSFNRDNEPLSQRDEEVLIPYTNQSSKGERVLRTTINNVKKIPYKETESPPKYNYPDLSNCTRIEILYEPFILDFFYPYKSQRALLSKEEMEYLGSEKNAITEDLKKINELENEIKQKNFRIAGIGGIVSGTNKAQISCFSNDRRIGSFIVYENSTVENEQNQRRKYISGLKSLKEITTQIQPFELRIECAANLKNLWYRLQFCDRAERIHILNHGYKKLKKTTRSLDSTMTKEPKSRYEEIQGGMRHTFNEDRNWLKNLLYNTKLVYPEPERWCDSMTRAYLEYGSKDIKWVKRRRKPHICPSVGKDMFTYAMNPNCRPDSPDDMVLLFETKGGWNQHGGPELFTLDNHEPKGGCVLLNDGTVKFIRTKEELQQLQWK